MKIVFCGEDRFSAIVLHSLASTGHELQLVVSPLYENFTYKKLELAAKKLGVKFSRYSEINCHTFQRELTLLAPDLLITCHFQKILDENIIKIPKVGCINLHPSLLPRYRGMAPQHWSIINGDSETGITIHFIDSGVDTGKIIIQKKIKIDENYYVSDLQDNMYKLYPEVMLCAIKLLENGYYGFKQNEIDSSYYGRLKPENVTINLDTSVFLAKKMIQAASFPYFGARFMNLVIWKADIVNYIFNKTSSIGINQNDKDIYLVLKDGALLLERYDLL